MVWQWGQEAVPLSFRTAFGDRMWYSWPEGESRKISVKTYLDSVLVYSVHCLFSLLVVLLIAHCLSPVHVQRRTPKMYPLYMCVHIYTEHRCLFTTALCWLLVPSLLLQLAASSCCAEAIRACSRGRMQKLVRQNIMTSARS